MFDLSFEAIVIIAVALSFDFVNGFHDAANSIATVVSTRVLSPRLAVAWAAFWNFAAFAAFGTAVALHTLGSKITKLQPAGGFAAETAAAMTLFATAHFGIPVSTTHTITGAIVGVGATNRLSAVRWGLTGRVVYAWIITIPGSALIAAVSYLVLQVIPATMVGVVGLLAALSWGVLFLIRRQREPESTVFAPPG